MTILKVYQVQAHQIQILHESEKQIKEFQIPALPQKLEQNTLSSDMFPHKAPLSAFSTFRSPSKKAHTHKLQTNKRNSQRLGSSFESTHMHMYK